MIIVTCGQTKNQKGGYKDHIAKEKQDEKGSVAEDVQYCGGETLCCVAVAFVVVRYSG